MKKGLVIGFTIIFMILVVGCSKDNKKEIKEISFNGMKLGDKATEEILKGLVMDGEYAYEFNNVGINIDKEQKITYLRTTAANDIKGNPIVKFDDFEIKYKNTSLKTIEDFKKLFGEGKTSKEDNSILYEEEDGISLYIYLKDDKIHWIELVTENKK